MITPNEDTALRKLTTYLADGLNAASQAAVGRDAVAGVREFQTDLNTVDRFPLLMVYRNRYRGSDLATCDLTVEYFVQNPVEIEQQPGLLNWVMRTLGELLSTVQEANVDPCLFVAPDQISGEIRFGQVRDGGRYFPFIRITIANVTDLN